MKSLKKLAAVGALMSVMNFAKAEEVTFKPTNFDGGEIESIELVNGQLLVRSNGNITGVETPYVYVGTNTHNFAQNGFAQGGLTNVNQYVHTGNGEIYMTEKNNDMAAWKTTISEELALNGVKKGLEKVKRYNDVKADALLQGTGYSMVANDGNSYTIKKDGVYETGTTVNSIAFENDFEHMINPEKIIVLDTKDGKKGFVLGLDSRNGNKKIFSSYPKANVEADDIFSWDNKLFVLKDGNLAMFEITKSGAELQTIDNSSLYSNIANFFSGKGIKSAVVANDTIYYATAKKLGYKKIER